MKSLRAVTEHNRSAALKPGQRVRLHSGADIGTITGIITGTLQRVIVRWDTGQIASWHPDDLVILAEQT